MFLFQYIYTLLLGEKDSDPRLLGLIQNLFFVSFSGMFLYFNLLYYTKAKSYTTILNLSVFEVIMVLLGLMLSFLLSRSEVFVLKPKKRIKLVIPITELIVISVTIFLVQTAISQAY